MKCKRLCLLGFVLVFLSLISFSCLALINESGRVAYYPLDNNANDSSGNNNHGTISGATSTNNGRFKGAYNFDGVDDKITSNKYLLNTTDPFSVFGWFKPTSTLGSLGYMLSKTTSAAPTGGTGFEFVQITVNGQSSLYFYNSTGIRNLLYGSICVYPDWCHIGFTFNGSTVNLYSNGRLNDTRVVGDYSPATLQTLTIGAYSTSPGVSETNGTIDEIRIYNRSLSVSEIKELYNQSLKTIRNEKRGKPSKGLINDTTIGNWHFDGNTNDSSGNNNNGIVRGANYTNKGKYGGAYTFDGINDNINVGNDTSLNINNTITLTAWVKAPSTAQKHLAFIAGKMDASGVKGYGLFGRNTASTEFCVAHYFTNCAYGNAKTDGLWHFYAGSYNGSIVRLWIDMTEQTTSPAYVGPINVVTEPFLIGGLAGFNFFNGTIDEVSVFNRSLSVSEIKELYNQSLKTIRNEKRGNPTDGLVDETGIVAKYNLDNNANDSSGNNNHGTISGATSTNNGRFKGAYNFDGVDDNINISYSQIFNMTGKSFSVSTWIYFNKSSIAHVVTKQGTSCTWCGWRLDTAGFYVFNSTTFSLSSSLWTALQTNTWYHLVGVWNGTNAIAYQNGIQKTAGSYMLGGEVDDNVALRIGTYTGTALAFNGSIDEVRIYNRSLSTSEVLQLYNNSTKTIRNEKRGTPTK